MALIQSTATGNWSAGATWIGGTPPGALDFGSISAGDTVTYDALATNCQGFILNGGTLVISKDFTFSDDSGAGIEVTTINSGGITTGATSSTPRVFKNEQSTPTNPLGFTIYDIVGRDDRALDFSYCEFRGFKMYLGNDNAYIEFNTGVANAPLILKTIPPTHDIRLIDHEIIARTTGGRIYPKSVSARVAVVTGKAHIDSFIGDQIKAILDTRKRIALVTDRFALMKCYIDRYRVDAPMGLFQSFSISVREDTN